MRCVMEKLSVTNNSKRNVDKFFDNLTQETKTLPQEHILQHLYLTDACLKDKS